MPDPTLDEVLAELRGAAALNRLRVSTELTRYDAVRFRFSAPIPRPNLCVDAQLYGMIEISPDGVNVSAGILSVDGQSAAYLCYDREWTKIYSGEEVAKEDNPAQERMTSP